MAKPEWGTKRTCPHCGARYYDLRSEPPVCPLCGTQFDPEALLRSRRGRALPIDDTRRIQGAESVETETALEDEVEANTEIEELEGEIPVEGVEEDVDMEEIEEEIPEDEEDAFLEETIDPGEDHDIVPDQGEDRKEH